MAQPERSPVADHGNPARLDDRGFVVLGAGQGIGRQTCHALSQAGARVLCVDRERELAEAVAAEIGGRACVADVVDRSDMERVFADARHAFADSFSGVVDIVGIADVRPLADMDDAGWGRQFDLVLRHAYLAIQLGAKAMSSGGSMVFVSSIAGMLSVENESTYGAAKAALNHLVRCTAHELGPRNIRINAVAPGFVRTPRLLAALSDDFWRGLNDYIPLRRAASPADIAKAILFLASDMSTCITGTVVTVDGGVSSVAALPHIPLGPAARKPAQQP
jgi:NAD(P)-dependent dehydrogenase (short-subunit alcohol dehydrogenase family)